MEETLSKNQTSNKKGQSAKPIFRIIYKNKLNAHPEQSDLMDLKVGDCLIPVYGGLTIYEIVEINRLNFTDSNTLKRIEEANIYKTYYNTSNQINLSYRNDKLKTLLDRYKANNNSGVCEIVMKCIFRNNKTVKKGKTIKRTEISLCPELYLRGLKAMKKVNYDSLLKIQENLRISYNNQITGLNKKIVESLSIQNKLIELRDQGGNQETGQNTGEALN